MSELEKIIEELDALIALADHEIRQGHKEGRLLASMLTWKGHKGGLEKAREVVLRCADKSIEPEGER